MSSEKGDLKAVERLNEGFQTIKSEIGKAIIGQDKVIEQLLIAILARGHCLFVGVPGLAKTLLISTLAKTLDLRFSRIQFTPDLMPSDITGTQVIEENRTTGGREFRFVKGPIFGNIILAVESNRTPPKTQSALLQDMQEYEVTAAGNTHNLEKPFFVLATQNPIEQEGTYPLPEAQLDRFMFNIYVDYPSEAEENEIVRTTTSAYDSSAGVVMKSDEILQLQDLVRRVPVADTVIAYAVRLARATRPPNSDYDYIKNWVSWGTGPRASQYMVLGAKTRAILHGRPTPSIEDIREVVRPVMRHRIVTSFSAEAEGVGTLDVVDKLLGDVAE